MVGFIIRRRNSDLLALELLGRGMSVRYEAHLILEVDQPVVMLCEYLVDWIGQSVNLELLPAIVLTRGSSS